MLRHNTRSLSAAILLVGLFTIAASSGVIAGPKEVEAKKYTDQLQTSKDAKVRAEAIEKLGDLAKVNRKYGVAALPDIKNALKDPDVNVRKAAAKAYGCCDPEDSDAVASLIDVLKNDKEEAVRKNAALGLKAMGEKSLSAVPELKQARTQAKDKQDQKFYRDVEISISGMKKK